MASAIPPLGPFDVHAHTGGICVGLNGSAASNCMRRHPALHTMNGVRHALSTPHVPGLVASLGWPRCTRCIRHNGRRGGQKKDYDAALKKLHRYFTPKTNVLYERRAFRRAVRERAKSVYAFASRSKRLAVPCNFGDRTEHFLYITVGDKRTSAAQRKRLLRDKHLMLDSNVLQGSWDVPTTVRLQIRHGAGCGGGYRLSPWCVRGGDVGICVDGRRVVRFGQSREASTGFLTSRMISWSLGGPCGVFPRYVKC